MGSTIPSVAVLLAAYNGEDWLNCQINSIIEQQDVKVKIFINLDKSNDTSLKIIKNLRKRSPNIIILSSNKVFGSAAKNFFDLILNVNFKNYDYIALADQDDIWNRDKLIKSIEALRFYNTGVVSSNVMAFWPNGREVLLQKSQRQRKFDHYFEAGGPGCTYLLKKEVMQDFKNFIQKNSHLTSSFSSHDWLIYWFCRSNDIKWYIIESSTMYYRQHNNNQIGANYGLIPKIKRIKQLYTGVFFKDVEILFTLSNETNIYIKKSKVISLSNIFELRRKKIESVIIFFFFYKLNRKLF